MIGQGDRTLTCRNGLDLGRIPALGLAGKIRNNTACPGLRRLTAKTPDQFAHQREIVNIGTGPHTDFPLQGRTCKIRILINLIGLYECRVIHDHPRPFCQTEPMPFRIAKMLGDTGGQYLRLGWLRQTSNLKSIECSGVRCDDHICGTVFTLRLHRLKQFSRTGFAKPDPYPGFCLKGLVHVLVGIIVPRRIHIQHARRFDRLCGRLHRIRTVLRGIAAANQHKDTGRQGGKPFHGNNFHYALSAFVQTQLRMNRNKTRP